VEAASYFRRAATLLPANEIGIGVKCVEETHSRTSHQLHAQHLTCVGVNSFGAGLVVYVS
jgi:hypothetical protein